VAFWQHKGLHLFKYMKRKSAVMCSVFNFFKLPRVLSICGVAARLFGYRTQ
jgi:hypothetical protein